MDLSLPKEMWFKIWNKLDFQTRQKTCVLVCKEWFDGIRADGRLSGQLFLENDEIEDADAEGILSKWENLKILRLSKNLDTLDLSKTHKYLKKVIVPKVPAGYQIVGMDVFKGYPVFEENGEIPVSVKKICFNPHDKSNSVGLKNIIEFEEQLFDDFEMHKPEFEGWELWTVMEDLLKDYEASVRSVCFNPQGSLNSVGFENITELQFFFNINRRFPEPPEPMGVMKNLKILEIQYRHVDFNFESGPFESTFQPWLKGFRFSSDLKEVRLIFSACVLDEAVINSAIIAWGDLISQYLPQITRLEVKNQDGYETRDTDLSWIPKLKNLKYLGLSDLNLGPFYKTPMDNLKRLELNGGHPNPSKNSTSLINLSKIFPALDTLIITRGEWKISALEGVLKSLGNIENLRASKIRCESYDFNEQMVKSTMEQALEIIQKEFPVDSTEIEIEAIDHCFTIVKEKGKEPSLKRKEFQNKVEDFDSWQKTLKSFGRIIH